MNRSTRDGARQADAREVVAAEVDEHHVLGAVLLRREQLARRRPRPARSCPRSGSSSAREPLAFDDRLGRAADEREAVELEQEEVRRRVDAAQRAVELEPRRPTSAARPAARPRPGTRRLRGCAPSPARPRRRCSSRPGKRRAARRPRSPVPRGSSGSGACRSALAASPRSTSATPRAWSKRTSTSGTTKRLSGRSGPSAGQRHRRLERRHAS